MRKICKFRAAFRLIIFQKIVVTKVVKNCEKETHLQYIRQLEAPFAHAEALQEHYLHFEMLTL